MAVVSGIPAVERLIFDDRPVEHNLSWPTQRRAYAKAWALSFRREKYSFLYGGKRAYIERRNYYDESLLRTL
jgi:hypothetical protein